MNTNTNRTETYVLVETFDFAGQRRAVLDRIDAEGVRYAGPTVTWAEWEAIALAQGDAREVWEKRCPGAERYPATSRPSIFDGDARRFGTCSVCAGDVLVRQDGRAAKHGRGRLVWAA